jgi:NitT/TauT family transport system substrate-binding protein
MTSTVRRLAPVLLVFAALSTPAAADDLVRVGALKAVHYTALWYLPEVGPRHGIKFEVLEFKKGLDAMEAMKAGAIDMASSGSDGAIAARASGVPVYIVAGFSKGGVMIVGRSDLALKSVAELKGRKVGVVRGGAQELALFMTLAKAGLTWSEKGDRDVTLVYLASYPAVNEALATKNIDAMTQIEPQAAIALGKGFGREIVKPYDTELGMPVKSVSMAARFYDERRPVAARVLEAFVDATRTLLARPDVARRFYTEVVFKGNLTQEDYDAALANSPFSYDVTADHIQKTIDAMMKYGVGRMENPPSAREFVKTDLLEAAKRALGVK